MTLIFAMQIRDIDVPLGKKIRHFYFGCGNPVKNTKAIIHGYYRNQITAGVQVLEFFEGEPCKFALFTSDHRMHFRAATVPSKQRWVRHLRTAIHKHVQEEDVTRVRSMTETTRHRSNAVMTGDRAAMDLKERRRSPVPTTHRPSSPFSKSRVNLIQSHNTETPIGSPVGFEVVSPSHFVFQLYLYCCGVYSIKL